MCLILCDPTDCSLPGSSVHGIFQARVLEWVAISFSKGSSWPRDQTRVSSVADRSLYCLSHNDNSNIPMTTVIATNLHGTFTYVRASPVGQKVNNLPAIQNTWVRSLGQEDPPEKGMATHFRFLPWRSLWTEEPGRLHSPWGGRESDMTEQLTLHKCYSSYFLQQCEKSIDPILWCIHWDSENLRKILKQINCGNNKMIWFEVLFSRSHGFYNLSLCFTILMLYYYY